MTHATQVFPTPEILAHATADLFCERAGAARGRFTVALSGGSTPKRFYELLATPAYSARLDWDAIHWFWGDERFVPHDHPDSNYRMAAEALLTHAPIARANIHPVPFDGHTPESSAAAYAGELLAYYGQAGLRPGRPLFDFVLLGLGDDGHTASLLPGSAALDEQSVLVTSVTVGRPEPRITLTYPAIASSRDVVFLVAGAGKRGTIAAIRQGEDFPAARVTSEGRITWLLDQAAEPDAGPAP
jgi:6-phosphogluconolactonase